MTRVLPSLLCAAWAMVAAPLAALENVPQAVQDAPAPRGAGAGRGPSRKPLALHPENPHYFLFRGRPAVLITSAEHYGAVLNRDFDYRRYLETLAAAGLNLTRVFSGAYVEPDGAFRIAKNTLAPASGRFICPWLRKEGGSYTFDLSRWDDAYFERLRDFLAEASRRGIVVEYVFFCPFYDESQWKLSPMNARNNSNGLGKVGREDVYTLDRHGGLLPVQIALVEKVTAELKDFDNLYYEVCNEPYFGGVTRAWHDRIADAIAAAEAGFPHRHLISWNVANGKAKVESPHPAVSIFNFHYASPPDTVAMNFGLGKPIGDNETGFRGTKDTHYRMEGWEFILAGGALYNNLDYSFTAEHEGGTFEPPPTQPGGGGPALRRQLKALKDFVESFEFTRMRPDDSVVTALKPDGVRARALVEPGEQYAVYFFGGEQVSVSLRLPGGEYRASWTDTLTGRTAKEEDIAIAPAGTVTIGSPAYAEDIALRLVRRR